MLREGRKVPLMRRVGAGNSRFSFIASSPKAGARSPKTGASSPNARASSPKARVSSLEAGMRSPKSYLKPT